MTISEKRILTQLQRGVEITSRPFQILEPGSPGGLADSQGLEKKGGGGIASFHCLEMLKKAKTDGLLRRFGGIFDARRLGYKSILCALDVPDDLIEEKAAVISAHSGVTHCYERAPLHGGDYPNLWFTFAMLHDEFSLGLKKLESQLETQPSNFFQLPALRRFKIDVVFDLHTVDRDETFPGNVISSDIPFLEFSEDEKILVRALDQQMPLVEQPFAMVAEQIGQSEEWVLATVQEWKKQGVLRRIGAILYHREAGFKANAMCVWPVDRNEIPDAGRRVAARPEVTHCYQRPCLEAFPFDLYAMIHTASWGETEALFEEISTDCGLTNGALFTSGREFKKSSMEYFR